MHYLAGLLAHAQAATPFTTPTINGYRRYKPNSLAPDRATWAYDHRGVMARVLGAPHDPATRIENRIGEPSANPYLYIAAQIVSGLDGIANKQRAGTAGVEPVQLGFSAAAEDAARCAGGAGRLERCSASNSARPSSTISLAFKRTELGRFEKWKSEHGVAWDPAGEPTEWEQNEYFDYF